MNLYGCKVRYCQNLLLRIKTHKPIYFTTQLSVIFKQSNSLHCQFTTFQISQPTFVLVESTQFVSTNRIFLVIATNTWKFGNSSLLQYLDNCRIIKCSCKSWDYLCRIFSQHMKIYFCSPRRERIHGHIV